jgi:integrase
MPRLRSKSPEARIYWRTRGGVRRAYLDVRDYRDVADKAQRALILPGESRATSDPVLAAQLAADHLAELEALRHPAPMDAVGARTLEAVSLKHLNQKKGLNTVNTAWQAQAAKHLATAADHFGADRLIDTITASEVIDFATHLLTLPNGRGGCLGASTVNQYLNSLSDMFGTAVLLGDGRLDNPVALLSKRHRPKKARVRALWLEIHEVADMLKWAQRVDKARHHLAIPFLYPLLATYVLTGCRRTEVLGLRREDVDLSAGLIHIRPNGRRVVKTTLSERTLLIPPQLKEILGVFETGEHAPQGDLYFPSLGSGTSKEAMIGDFEKLLDRYPMPARFTRIRTDVEMAYAEHQQQTAVAARRRKMERDAKARGRDALSERQEETLTKLGAQPISREVTQPLRPLLLRHTWCAARLQCVQNGLPIAPFQVAAEMGHADLSMIQKVYGHVQNMPRRGAFVDYR